MRRSIMVLGRMVLAAMAIAGRVSYGEEGATTFFPSGFVSLREGQIVKGEPERIQTTASNEHVWVQEMIAGFNVKMKLANLPAQGNLGMEMSVNNDNSSYPSDFGQSRRLNFYPYLSRADLVYSFGSEENPGIVLDAGYFPFKYNNSVRNLGEYLFRSGTYPQYLITDFDFPMARLLGLHLSGPLGASIQWDVLATTNTEWRAIGDLNVTGLFTWKPLPLFELGLGGSWCSALSVNWDNATPPVSGNDYVYDSAVYYYTVAGPKVMGRFTLDFKQLFPQNDLFGEQDLKLYSEAAILGLFNYPMSVDSFTQYDTLWQRIPIMVGFNFPTFKFMDVFNAEVEWFGNPYPNSINSMKFENQPIPLSSSTGEKSKVNLNNHFDDWKWSVYGKKTFADHFNITFQFARDHMRWFRLDYTKADGMEALRRNDEWYYTFKLGYTF